MLSKISDNQIELKSCDFIICNFFSFDDFCNFFYLINFYFYKNNLNYLFKYFEFYKYKNSYFLIIKKINLFNNYFQIIFLYILEFANSYYFSELLIRKIYEFGDLIFNYKNINKFKKLLKNNIP